jgi:hypothetical protein
VSARLPLIASLVVLGLAATAVVTDAVAVPYMCSGLARLSGGRMADNRTVVDAPNREAAVAAANAQADYVQGATCNVLVPAGATRTAVPASPAAEAERAAAQAQLAADDSKQRTCVQLIERIAYLETLNIGRAFRTTPEGERVPYTAKDRDADLARARAERSALRCP